MCGLKTLEKFMNDSINEIEVNEPVQVVKNCVPGEACEAKDFFEMITECAICGKLV